MWGPHVSDTIFFYWGWETTLLPTKPLPKLLLFFSYDVLPKIWSSSFLIGLGHAKETKNIQQHNEMLFISILLEEKDRPSSYQHFPSSSLPYLFTVCLLVSN